MYRQEKAWLLLLSAVWLSVHPAWAVDVNSLPAPTGYVNDFAHVVDPQSKQELEDFCTRVDHELGVQFALVTVDTVGDTPIRDFGLELGRKWGVGDKQSRQGVVLVIAVKDHKTDLDTERGIEPYITDGFAGSTLRAMRPYLRAGQFGPALMMAAQSMAQQIAQGKNISFNASAPIKAPAPEVRRHRHSFSPGFIIFVLFLLFWLIGRRRGGGPRMRGGGGGGFVTGMLIGDLLSRGGRGGGWGDGGGFGGNSGGGGGFGGFGGGGDFGGGGASSNW